MGRIKKFLYFYFCVILLFVVVSALGGKTISGEPPIGYLFSSPQIFGGITLVLFIVSLFL